MTVLCIIVKILSTGKQLLLLKYKFHYSVEEAVSWHEANSYSAKGLSIQRRSCSLAPKYRNRSLRFEAVSYLVSKRRQPFLSKCSHSKPLENTRKLFFFFCIFRGYKMVILTRNALMRTLYVPQNQTLREKCPNTEFFQVCIWTLFKQ